MREEEEEREGKQDSDYIALEKNLWLVKGKMETITHMKMSAKIN